MTLILSYDALNQMKSEQKMNQGLTSRLYEYQYQFDAAGNRTQMKYFDGSTTATTSYTHNDGNQLTARTVGNHEYSYFYDNNGNMTSEEDIPGPVREFTWNEDNRLTEVVRDEYGTSSYVYDALGRRLVRTSGTTSTFYYYDGLTVIAEKEMTEKEGEWIWKRVFTVAPGVIGNIFRISEKSGESWSDAYYHYDAIGNVVLRTNSSGSVIESLDQDAYGNVKLGSQAGYHLTTKEYDAISELHYFSARWYDNTLGRFISHDPIPSGNLYRYCRNNPVVIIDPSGKWGFNEHWNWTYQLVLSITGDTECAGDAAAFNVFEDMELLDTRYHFPSVSEYWLFRNSSREQAFGSCDCTALGSYLHFVQDYYSHYGWPGAHPPFIGIDNPSTHPYAASDAFEDTARVIDTWWSECKCKYITNYDYLTIRDDRPWR